MAVRVLHILAQGHTPLSERIVLAQSEEYDIHVIDLSLQEIAYEEIVDEIFGADRVICW